MFWSGREDPNLRLADSGSKKDSMDDWGLDTKSFKKVVGFLGTNLTVDALASESNSRCPVYFSKLPETKSSGVDFFLQPLQQNHVYWISPSVCLIQRAWRTVLNSKGMTAIFAVPNCLSNTFYADFKDKDNFKSVIVKQLIFYATFRAKSASCLFNGSTKFDTLVMLVKT